MSLVGLRPQKTPLLVAICLLPAALFAAGAAPAWGADELETGPGFDPAAPAETPAEVTDPAKEWASEADRTASLIRRAVAEGAAAGRRERITIKFGGRSQSAKVVSADETRIVVSLPGVQVPLQWERVDARTMYAIGRKYLPAGEARTHVRLGLFCLVHGFTEEAEEEFLEALRTDRAAVKDVRSALDFIRRQDIERAVAKVGSVTKRRAPRQLDRRGPKRARPRPGWEHPYIGFSRSDVPVLKARFKGPGFSRRWSRLLSNANAHLGSRPPSSAGGVGSSRNALGIAGTTAFAYAITGEWKFAERAKAEAFGLISARRWMSPAHARIVSGADLVTAEASVACALVYDWCHDAMSEEERERLKDGILRLGVGPYLKSLDKRDWWVNNLVTNWCGVCHGGCGLAALALYDESPEAKRGAEEAFEYCQKFIRSAVLEDGGGHEGVMYWRYGVEFGHYFFTAAERMFGVGGELYADETRKLAGYWDCYMQGPDMKYANFNDMNESTFAGLGGGHWEGGPNSPLSALFESKVPGGDPLLLWAADNGGAAYYWKGASPFYLLWRRVAPAAGAKPPLQEAALFRGAGHVIWRSPRLWFVYNGGWISDKSHYNCDLGTFVLVVGEERLVNDPGYGLHRTGEHSTVIVNGSGQRKGTRATFLRYGSGDGFRYLASDMSDCYGGRSTGSGRRRELERSNGGAALKKYVRHAVMVGGSYIVLVDDLAASAPADYEWRLQTRSQVEVLPDKKGGVVRGRAERLYVAVASPGDAEMSTGRAAIPFLRIKPGARRAAAVIAAVLYPTGDPVSAPRVSFKAEGAGKAVLTVAHPSGKKDRLVFADAKGYLTLVSVNKESASGIGPPVAGPEGRTIRPFRRGR